MEAPKAKILVVEDDPAIRTGLLDVLVFNGYAATGEEDGRRGLEAARRKSFDLVILDVMLPSMDGFAVCRELRAAKPRQPILMLTAKGAEEDIVTGFQAGADDYVSKPFSLRELMVRIEALLRRSGKLAGEEEIVWNAAVFRGKTLEVHFDGRVGELTRREMDIVAYLFHHQDRIVSKKELLTEVWHYADADIETRTVDIHMLKLRKKIAAVAGDIPFIQTVRGQGYRLESRP
ncbi:MAG: response regulator transcription factor [Desulfobacterales bacterium]|nr:response regulator transcription factor [Desulfobacterales bacterium]